MKKKLSRRSKWILLTVSLLLLLIALICAMPHLEDVLYPRDYAAIVEEEARLYGIPSNLIYAVIHTESGFDADAVSHAGACGLMQLMPDTFLWLSHDMLGESYTDKQIFDPRINIHCGVYHLSRLYRRYGDWITALAAYNAGDGRVNSWLEDPSMVDARGFLIADQIPITETRNYVSRIQKAFAVYESQIPSGATPFDRRTK